MEKLTISPDLNAFYTVISALCRYGNIEEAEEFMLLNKKLFLPEIAGFNIILHGWCDIFVDVVEAKRVWREMGTYCVTPDAISYTHMISCFSREGARPTIETYQAFLKSANLEGTFEILSQMKKDEVGPDNCTFLLIFNRFFKLREPENVLKFRVEMKHFGLPPGLEHYKSLNKWLGKLWLSTQS